MNKIPYIIDVIEKLRWNAQLGKHSHFNASQNGTKYHIWVGLPIVILNVIIGSLLFALIKETLPDWSKWAGGILALVAAMLGAAQTFFDFKGNYEGHRNVGNQYLSIARECERLIALYFDERIKLDDLSEQVQVLNERYEKINIEAEKYPITDKDYKKTLAMQNQEANANPSLVQRKKAELEATSNEESKNVMSAKAKENK